MAFMCEGKRPMVNSDMNTKEGVTSESSSMININVCSSSINNNSEPPLEDDSSDTSLKLG